MANPLKVLTTLSASSGVAVSGSDGLKINQGGLTVSAGTSTFAGTTISNLGTVTTADINGGTIDGATIATSDITVGASKTLDVAAGTLTLANGQVAAGKVGAGTFNAGTFSFNGSTISDLGTVTTADINGGSIDGATIGASVQSSGKFTSISGSTTLEVGGTSTLVGDVTFGGNIVADANENKSIFAAVTSNTITVGAAGATVSIPGTASVGGHLTVTGDLTVNGTTTTLNTQELLVEDKNIILGAGTGGGSDLAVDGGGITLSGSTNHTFNWIDATDAWTSSEHLDLASGKDFKIGGLTVVKTGSLLGGFASNASILTSGSAQGVFAVAPIMGNTYVIASGSNVALKSANVNIGPSALSDDPAEIIVGSGLVTFSALSEVKVDKILNLTASGNTFTYVTASGGYVNVINAINTLDEQLAAIGSGASVTPTEYYNVRTVVSGTKQAGSSDVVFILSGAASSGESGRTPFGKQLTGLSSNNSTTLLKLLGGMSFDVAVKPSGSTNWTNDLVSVTVAVSGTDGAGNYWPKITVDAPALDDSSEIRLIAVNENLNVIT